MLKQRLDEVLLVVALTGCHATTPVQPVGSPHLERSARQETTNIDGGQALPLESPMPTANSVGMWLQMETGTGWGSRQVSIFANGKIVRLTWNNGKPAAKRKYVDRSILEGINRLLQESGVWDLPAHCCECLDNVWRRVDDGFFAIFRSFEPGRIGEVEYHQDCHEPPPDFPDLVSRIDTIIGESGWINP
jgi:hypothetical protein